MSDSFVLCVPFYLLEFIHWIFLVLSKYIQQHVCLQSSFVYTKTQFAYSILTLSSFTIQNILINNTTRRCISDSGVKLGIPRALHDAGWVIGGGGRTMLCWKNSVSNALQGCKTSTIEN